jgi:hypothetical protein
MKLLVVCNLIQNRHHIQVVVVAAAVEMVDENLLSWHPSLPLESLPHCPIFSDSVRLEEQFFDS